MAFADIIRNTFPLVFFEIVVEQQRHCFCYLKKFRYHYVSIFYFEIG